jgi:hypothetical protein
VPQPGHTDAIAGCESAAGIGTDREHLADDLMPGDDPGPVYGQIAFCYMQIRTTDPARQHRDGVGTRPSAGTHRQPRRENRRRGEEPGALAPAREFRLDAHQRFHA